VPVSISQPSNYPYLYNHDYVTSISYSGTPLAISASLLVSKKIQPNIPQSQSSLLKSTGLCYEIKLSNNIKTLPQWTYININMNYSDIDVANLNEDKLGIAYWDE